MRVVTFKLDEKTLTRLDEVARNFGLSRSEVIRAAIYEYLSRRCERSLKVKRVQLT